jgi:hypothetical protein
MMKRDSFEEQYLDVLQNLEFAIVQAAREYPELTDWHAQSAVNALMKLYRAEAAGDEIRDPSARLDPLAKEVYDGMHSMAEWRQGRVEVFDEDGEPMEISLEPLTVQEMYDCLKRIRKSIQKWTKWGGRKGYLNYIDEFFPDGS